MKKLKVIKLFFLLAVLLFLKNENLQSQVTAKLISEVTTIQPDQKFWVLVDFHLDEGWHLYWKNPGDAGKPPEFSWQLPEGFSAGKPQFPVPSKFQVSDQIGYGYANELLLLVPITAPSSIVEGKKYDLQADVSWVSCKELCVPGKTSLQTAVVASRFSEVNQETEALFQKARRGLPRDDVGYSVQFKEGFFDIKVFDSNEPFGKVQSVEFFPEDAHVVDIKTQLKWEYIKHGENLLAQVKAVDEKNAPQELKGVLVISFSEEILERDLAINIFKEFFPPATGILEPEKNAKIALLFEQELSHLSALMGSGFGYVLVLAFFGGMILNIMPCVLPIISLKILNFIQLQGQSRSTTFKHGLAFSFGVLLSFWALAFAIYALQMLGKTVGWGFQLQEPLFVAVLVIVLFALSLSLFGVFEFGTSVAAKAAELESAAKKIEPLKMKLPAVSASFWSGVLATFVATPCTGPLLGSAIGFAATLDPLYSGIVFTTLGIGMAFPYLLISLFPPLIKFIPKPGRWMVTFKQLMGFFMLATVLWLIWVLEAETNDLSRISLFSSLFLIAFGFWIYGTWASFDRKKLTRAFGKIVAFLVILLGCFVLLYEVNEAKTRPNLQRKQMATDWEPFSEEKLSELRHKGIPVFVDVTAKWCLTCQANGLILELDQVKEAFTHYGVQKMLADWTQNDEAITKYLRSLGRNGVPVYAVYGKDPDKGPAILPEVLTPEIVIKALKDAHDGK